MSFLEARVHDAELLDQPEHDLAELEESLRMVDQVNRWFAGSRSLHRQLAPHCPPGVARRVLDVGTGDGGCALRLRSWARRRGGRWTVVGLDLHAQMVSLARARSDQEEPLTVVRGNALRLPFRDEAFDIAFSSLTLHHFDDEDAVRVVREMARVSRTLVAVSDIERTRLGLAGAKVLAATLWRRNRLTRTDGPLSVRRSFTATELFRVGQRAGLDEPRVRRYFPSRLVLVGSTGGAGRADGDGVAPRPLGA